MKTTGVLKSISREMCFVTDLRHVERKSTERKSGRGWHVQGKLIDRSCLIYQLLWHTHL